MVSFSTTGLLLYVALFRLGTIHDCAIGWPVLPYGLDSPPPTNRGAWPLLDNVELKVNGEGFRMRCIRALFVSILVLMIVILSASKGIASPAGQMTWAVDISLAPGWFDPGETSGIVTPWLV